MTTFTFCDDIFSDMHKDAYGFRPRGHRFYDPSTTDEEKQKIWDWVQRDVERAIDEDRARQKEAVATFETRIDQLIKVGAGSRETAIRWIREAYDADSGYQERVDFIEFDNGLPIGYLSA